MYAEKKENIRLKPVKSKKPRRMYAKKKKIRLEWGPRAQHSWAAMWHFWNFRAYIGVLEIWIVSVFHSSLRREKVTEIIICPWQNVKNETAKLRPGSKLHRCLYEIRRYPLSRNRWFVSNLRVNTRTDQYKNSEEIRPLSVFDCGRIGWGGEPWAGARFSFLFLSSLLCLFQL